jgi:hypothetical protein
VSRGRSNACSPLAPRIDKNLGNSVVKKVYVRTLADRRWIRLLSFNNRLCRTTLRHPEHSPLYVLARTELPQLIWGTTSKGASAILRAWGIRYLTTTSPCELQNNTNPNSHNRYASNNLSTVSCSASTAR